MAHAPSVCTELIRFLPVGAIEERWETQVLLLPTHGKISVQMQSQISAGGPIAASTEVLLSRAATLTVP